MKMSIRRVITVAVMVWCIAVSAVFAATPTASADSTNPAAGLSSQAGGPAAGVSSQAGGASGLTAGLVAWWKFDGDFKDATGSGLDGTAVGSVSFAGDGIGGSQCAVFDHGYLNVAKGASFALGKDFTFAAWVKLDPSTRDMDSVVILSKAGDDNNWGSGGDEFEVYGSPQDMELLDNHYGDLNTVDTQPAGYIDCDQKWTHLAFAGDGTTLYAYVDGKLVNTAQVNGSAITNSTGPLMIGNAADGVPYVGKMDDLRIYNRVLSASEIQALANTGSYAHKIVLKLLSPTITVDGQQMQIDPSSTSVYPYSDNGHTLVPIRIIVEKMGGHVSWDPNAKEVDITLGSKIIKLWIDKMNAEVNGQQMTLDAAPTVVAGRTFLPLRFVAENLGAKVDWNGNTEEITLSY